MARIFSVSLLLVLLVTVSHFQTKGSENEAKISEKVVNTKNGPVQGVVKKSRNPSVEFISYWGLRYANPPLRFEPAKPLDETWTGPKVVKAPGNICIQPQFGASNPSSLSDDCLFLNVYVPSSKSQEKLPVMFWVHGGGFGFGEGHTYGPEYLMENEDVILVTVNYRLGVLGFISMEDDNVFTSNNGLRDLVLALKYVQENIAAFGGDPDNLTLFGESAGSAAVHYLLMSPLTKGLYHRAIMQSGAFCFWAHAENPKLVATKFAKAVGCKNTKDAGEIRKCLESTSAEKLMNAQSTFFPRWPPANPIPRFLPTANEPQDNPFFSGKASSFFTFHGGKTPYPSNVPVILGVTREEGATLFTSFILATEGLLEAMDVGWNNIAPKTFAYEDFFPKHKLAGISKKIREFYFGDQPVTKDNLTPLMLVYSDSQMLLPTIHAAEEMAKNGMNAYPYIYSYYGEKSALEALLPRIPDTVGHADDLPYLFTHPFYGIDLKPGSEDEKFSKKFVKMWTNFAKTGVPKNVWDERNIWNPVKVENDSVTKFEIFEIDSNPKIVSSHEIRKRLEFWRRILKEAWEDRKSEKTEL